MTERAERINGWAAMIGIIAAMGSYAVSGQIIPGIWQIYNAFNSPSKQGGEFLLVCQEEV